MPGTEKGYWIMVHMLHESRTDKTLASRLHGARNDRAAKPFREHGQQLLKDQLRVPFPTPELRDIPANRLFVDDGYQRHHRPEWSRKIAVDFDPDKFEPLRVSDRGDGRYAVIDGQHRLASIELLGWLDCPLPCLVYHGLTINQEAELYATQMDRLKLSPQDTHLAAVTAGRPDAVLVEDAIRNAGYRTTLARTKQYDVIDAISTCYAILRTSSQEMLSRILALLAQTWMPRQWQPKPEALLGLRAFLSRYDGEYDEARLRSVLEGLPPEDLKRLESGQRHIMGGSIATNAARVLTQRYNKLLRTNRLPDWDHSIDG